MGRVPAEKMDEQDEGGAGEMSELGCVRGEGLFPGKKGWMGVGMRPEERAGLAEVGLMGW
jgi:hypothetical protein